MKDSWSLTDNNTTTATGAKVQPEPPSAKLSASPVHPDYSIAASSADVASSTKVLVGAGDGSDGSSRDSEKDDEACCLRCCAPEARPAVALWKICLCCLAGVVFGWCMEKSRVFEPSTIRLQMVVERWVMLKMFIAAIASGQVVLALMSVIPWCKVKFQKAMDGFSGCFGEKGIFTSVAGPFILGMGMTVSGACPGMILPQVGAWVKNSIYTFLGVLLGALLYGMVAPFIVKVTRPKTPFKKLTFHEIFKVPYIALALPMGLLMGVVVFLLEWFIPWAEDLDCWNRNEIATPDASSIFTQKSWSPGAAGAVLGALQVLIVLAADDTLGGSSAYVTLVSQWVVGKKLKTAFPYLAKARCGIGNWWQVFYVMFAVGGGAFSALSSDSIATTQGVSVPSAVCGGFMLLIGARLAAGCTSGHGLSGMGLLFWFSFVAVPAMFAGGFVVGFSMQATGALYDFHCHSDVGYCPPIPTTNCTGFF